MKLTVYYDGSFWCGLVEYVHSDQQIRVIRHVFGNEPKNEEVLFFIHHQLPALITQTDSLPLCEEELAEVVRRKMSPKRMQRKINRDKRQPAVSTKAQAALKMQQETAKRDSKKRRKAAQLLDAQQKFQKKQDKKRQKHKGH